MKQHYFNATEIFDSTAKQCDLKNYADDGMRNRFTQFIESMNETAAVSDLAYPAAVKQLSQLVRNRLELARDWQVYPEIHNETIEQPIFVLGSGRTGTSAMQSLLALGEGCRAPLVWESGHPSPPPGLDPEADVKHIEQEHKHIRDLINVMPGMLLSHPYVDAGGLMETEDEDLLVLDFHTIHPFHLTRVPNVPIVFQNKVSGLSDALAFHKMLLKHFQWKQPTQRWICKGTQHHYQIPAIWQVYPDALCVWTHRDPVAFIGSILGIVEHVYFTQVNGRNLRGSHFVDEIVAGIRAGYDSVFAGNWLDDERIVHIRFEDFIHDQVAIIRKIYDRAGMVFTPACEAQIKAWLADSSNRSDRHGKYTYSVEDYGLDADELKEQFADYYEHFLR